VSTMGCPPSVASILLELTSLGILRIRAYSHDPTRCVIEADHIHNLPELVRNYSHSLFSFYWDVERPSFIEQTSETDRAAFEPLWDELRDHAESLGVSSAR
jgi:hypothetical protein